MTAGRRLAVLVVAVLVGTASTACGAADDATQNAGFVDCATHAGVRDLDRLDDEAADDADRLALWADPEATVCGLRHLTDAQLEAGLAEPLSASTSSADLALERAGQDVVVALAGHVSAERGETEAARSAARLLEPVVPGDDLEVLAAKAIVAPDEDAEELLFLRFGERLLVDEARGRERTVLRWIRDFGDAG